MARILLGVSGGIAAYKAVELARLAIRAGHSLRAIQTPASLHFLGRQTLAGVTGAPVLVEEWERDPARGAFPGEPAPEHDPISHLELVRRCDLLCVAPASANTLAKLASGLADNLLTSAALASTAPLVLAPAMNGDMYEHPATRSNLELLEQRGALVIEPDSGALASRGERGVGRLPEPERILAAVERRLGERAPRSLVGLRVLVTAGGTREPIDAVRFVGNRSSGRMGLALAQEAAARGAEVTTILANVLVPRPHGIRHLDVETAEDLERVARAEFERADVLVMAAAVGDFRPSRREAGKIAKAGRGSLSLDLEPTTDVLASLARLRRRDQTLVGFAAEHGEGARERAREKLERKRLDAIVVNDVSRAGIGFESADNEVAIVTREGALDVPRGSKAAVAAAVMDAVERLRRVSASAARGTAVTVP